ncbi:hypothetical protein E1H99_07405 [Enterococcus hirae]|nr:hypothetical protein E1H99_07405 [Enterococcus hirae]
MIIHNFNIQKAGIKSIPSNLSYWLIVHYIKQRRLGQKRLTPRNKKGFMKIVFQIFVNPSLLSKKLLLIPPFICI